MINTGHILSLIRSGDCGAVSDLAEQGTFDGITAWEKRRLVFTAAQSGQAEMLRFLFEANHLYSSDPDRRNRTLLHQAALSGDASLRQAAIRDRACASDRSRGGLFQSGFSRRIGAGTGPGYG